MTARIATPRLWPPSVASIKVNSILNDCSLMKSLALMTARLTLASVFFLRYELNSNSNQNKFSKPRMVKFYQSVESEALQQTVIRRVFQQIAARPDSFCNYLEGIVPEWGEGIK
jgi:hypothetical protein